MMDDRIKIVDTALEEVGYKEKKSNKDLDSKTLNAGKNDYTKYGKWYGKTKAEWCVIFVCWVYAKNNLLKLIKKTAYAPTLLNFFKKKHEFIERGSNIPKKADIIFINWDGKNTADHCGIVYKVDRSYVYTVEGNYSNMVKKRKYKLTDKRIIGYGSPKFPNESAKIYTPGKYIVTSNTYLHVRTGPSTKYRIKKFKELTKNAQEQVLSLNHNKVVNGLVKGVKCDVTSVKNVCWGKIPSGWIDLDYTKKN